MKRFIPRLVASAMIAIFAGCSRMGSPRYYIYMVNLTPRDIEGASVYFDGKMAAEEGHLVKAGLASYGYVSLPIPDAAEVRWDDAEGHHAPKVKLTGIVPSRPVNMDIYFVIHNDGSVVVSCCKYDDMAARDRAEAGLVELRNQIRNTPGQ